MFLFLFTLLTYSLVAYFKNGNIEQAEREAAIQEHESPSIQVKPFGTGKDIGEASIKENELKEGKRIVKPSMYLKSPYNNKMANVMEPLTEDETLLAYNVFSMEGYIL